MKSNHLCAFIRSSRSVFKKTVDGNMHSTSILKWPDVKHVFTEGLFWRWRGRRPWSISDLFTCDERLKEVSCDQLLKSSSEDLPSCMETVALSVNDLCELWLGLRQCGSTLTFKCNPCEPFSAFSFITFNQGYWTGLEDYLSQRTLQSSTVLHWL